jgi:hypothetical protein
MRLPPCARPQVRQTIAVTRQSQRGPSSPKPGSTWRSLSPEQLTSKQAAVDNRRKALKTSMPANQWEAEQKWVPRDVQHCQLWHHHGVDACHSRGSWTGRNAMRLPHLLPVMRLPLVPRCCKLTRPHPHPGLEAA